MVKADDFSTLNDGAVLEFSALELHNAQAPTHDVDSHKRSAADSIQLYAVGLLRPNHHSGLGEIWSLRITRGRAMSFALKSTAFANGGEISKRYTCDGADRSPALNWDDAPAGTHSLAVITDDPDAPVGTWTHWIIWNIPAQATVLPEGVPKVEVLDNGARQGRNDFKRIGYGGPCPPPGKRHRYFFKLYALDARLDVKAGASRNELELAMKRHVLSQTELMGTYRR
jgi:Raf kinase inhibitor-like YbhB/YbcL family protein